MKRHKMISIFRRFYLLFAVLIIIIYVSMIAITLKYARQQREGEISSMQTSVLFSISNLEQQLDIIYAQECNLITDFRITALVEDNQLNAYDRLQLVRGQIANAQWIKSMNSAIGNVTIMLPQQELELSANDGSQKKSYVRREPLNGKMASRILQYENGNAKMELFYPLTYSIEETYVPDFGIGITLSNDYLSELLTLLEGDDGEGAFFILDDGEHIFSESQAEEILKDCWYTSWKEQGEKDSFIGFSEKHTPRYLFVSERLPEYGITLVAYREGMVIERSMILALVVMAAVLVVISILFIIVLFQTATTVERPLHKMVVAFEEVQKGNLNVRIYHKTQDEFQKLYETFNKMTERIQKLIEDLKEQAALLQNAELIQLQSQINPHFLYNSFYLIRIMVKNEDYDQIQEFVTSLAKYYRFLNKEVDQNIEFQREVEHMKNYIDIQQMRFGDKIVVTEGQLPEEVAAYRMPKLILQPIVENAYNYGMKDVVRDGKIAIHYQIEEKRLFIIIEDSGSDSVNISEELGQLREYVKDYKGRAAGHALSNIDRRLKLAYGEAGGIRLEESELGGLKIILQFDLTIQMEEHVPKSTVE